MRPGRAPKTMADTPPRPKQEMTLITMEVVDWDGPIVEIRFRRPITSVETIDELGQQLAHPPDHLRAPAEVNRPLAPAVAKGDPEIGPQPAPRIDPPGGHHAPLPGEPARLSHHYCPHPLKPRGRFLINKTR